MKTLIVDVEANGLENPTEIHVVVAKDFDTGETYVYRNAVDSRDLLLSADRVVGHNFVSYDARVLERLAGIRIDPERIVDTLVVSRLVWYHRPGGHSLAAWGSVLSVEKKHADVTEEFFRQWSQELEDRCVSDVEINTLVFQRLRAYIDSPKWAKSISIEHYVARVCVELHTNGFTFDLEKARPLRHNLSKHLETLDKEIKESFPPKLKFLKEYTPRITKHGTVALNSIPRSYGPDLTAYSFVGPFSHLQWQEFDPGSPKQVVERLNEAGWRPQDKTKGHIEALKDRDTPAEKLARFRVYGWTLSDENLATLPDTAPKGAQKLAERRIIANRVVKLDEWLGAVRASNGEYTIHGDFSGIGAWTQRLSHSKPNMANVPTRKPQDTPRIAGLNDTLRTLWIARRKRLLVGVDADQIQLRVLAHYLQDERFTNALVNGNKELGTDVHSLNVGAIGPACQGRRDAKTFIYAWVLDAGVARVAEILGCDRGTAKDVDRRFIEYYPGLKRLREDDIRRDARRGYFVGLDGRFVKIYGDEEDERRHYTLGGYLQNGEKLVMAYAIPIWKEQLRKDGLLDDVNLVNWVHDEFQLDVPDDMEVARHVSSVVADSIRLAGDLLGCRCPMKGSMMGGHDRLAIGKNWLETH